MLFFAWPYRLAAITLCIAAVVAISQALAAANTVPATYAGDGSGTISGYTVSSVVYTLNGTNPQNLDQVDFNVDVAPQAGSTMKIKLVAAGSTWYTCTNVTTALTCVTTAPQATTAAADELRVVIAD